RASRAMSDLATMRGIVEAYAADEGKGSYPAPDNTADNGIAAVLKAHGVNWTGGTDGIKDPWGSPYWYDAPLTGSNYLKFILVSPGPDKSVGTADDIYCTNTRAPVTGNPNAADPPLVTGVQSAQ
ncbi:MAG: type II secretion system protein GspG, partial [Bacillota bacterium]|nr:type II secretion system protein GspG [Bacillota bacterium]